LIVALSLFIYGAMLAVLGPRLIGMLTAGRQTPRLAVVTWQIAAVSVVLAWAAGGVAMATPIPPVDALGHLLTSCITAVHEAAADPGGRVPQVVGLLLSSVVVARAVWCITTAGISRGRWRQRHVRGLRIVAKPAPTLGAVVLDHPAAVAYCIPGRFRQTVLTRGALDVLADDQLGAVLAHEQAHLRGRHDLALASIQALTCAFPRVPVLTAAAREIPVLLEMCADDAAARRHGPAAVVGALRVLSSRGSPEGTLAAGGSSAPLRIVRLLSPRRHRLRSQVALGSAAALLAAGPLIAATVPVLVVAAEFLRYCPIPPMA